MKITLLTTACYRPEAWALCEGYMKAQTRQPDQWLVLDDDETPTVCAMGQDYHHWPECRGRGSLTRKIVKAVNSGLVKGDAVVIVENDDQYAPTYLETVAKWLEQADLVGEGNALYYNVQHRKWFEHKNHQHASFCSTAFRASVFPLLLKACNTDDPYVDFRLWNLIQNPLKKKVWMPQDHVPGGRLVIGMKGMPGKLGYGTGHTIEWMKGCHPDPQLTKLTQLMGANAQSYAPFYVKGSVPVDTKKYLSPTDKGHGDKWEKWLAHLKGTPARGLEVGTFRGESAECLLSRVFTHPESHYYCVDWFKGSEEHKINRTDISTIEEDARKRLERFKNCTIIKGMSHDILREFKEPLDWAYIDAAHDSMNVLRDGILAFDLLKIGGLICFDDWTWKQFPDPVDNPGLAIQSFMQCYKRRIQPVGIDSQACFRKLN